jgi:hypothetical protein
MSDTNITQTDPQADKPNSNPALSFFFRSVGIIQVFLVLNSLFGIFILISFISRATHVDILNVYSSYKLGESSFLISAHLEIAWQILYVIVLSVSIFALFYSKSWTYWTFVAIATLKIVLATINFILISDSISVVVASIVWAFVYAGLGALAYTQRGKIFTK